MDSESVPICDILWNNIGGIGYSRFPEVGSDPALVQKRKSRERKRKIGSGYVSKQKNISFLFGRTVKIASSRRPSHSRRRCREQNGMESRDASCPLYQNCSRFDGKAQISSCCERLKKYLDSVMLNLYLLLASFFSSGSALGSGVGIKKGNNIVCRFQPCKH